MKKILLVAAHPDDELLGCGGTIAKAVKMGDQIKTVILGEGMLSRKHATDSLTKLRDDSKKANHILGVDSVTFYQLPDNAFDTIPLLSIVRIVEREVEEFTPEVIFTHYGHDLNIDHRRTFEAVLTACRPQPKLRYPDIYSFFIASSTDWIDGTAFPSFAPNVYFDISDTINQKLDALACYVTKMKEFPHSRSLESLRIFSQYWGNRVGKNYVEPFILVRSVRDAL